MTAKYCLYTPYPPPSPAPQNTHSSSLQLKIRRPSNCLPTFQAMACWKLQSGIVHISYEEKYDHSFVQYLFLPDWESGTGEKEQAHLPSQKKLMRNSIYISREMLPKSWVSPQQYSIKAAFHLRIPCLKSQYNFACKKLSGPLIYCPSFSAPPLGLQLAPHLTFPDPLSLYAQSVNVFN